jgi:TRAP-type C4-dicarboxylate transport system substrate-binding protein
LQWFTKAKYLTDLPITYVCGATVVSAEAFKRIKAEDQKIVHEVLGRAIRTLDENSRDDNQEARQALLEQGVEFVRPTPETRTKWEEIAASATERLVAEQGYDPAIMKMMENLVEEYRSRQATEMVGD